MNNKTPGRGQMRTDCNGMTTVTMATQEEYTMATLRFNAGPNSNVTFIGGNKQRSTVY
ncbi:hypothetical protein OS493_011442, partial [Desmophyllum pertusum]